MKTQAIRKMIAKAVEDERETGRLAAATKDMAKNNGRILSAKQVNEIVEFVQGYIEHVPFYLEQGIAAAKKVGLQAEMNQMAAELEAYWFTDVDLIPDHFGLIGLMDDAYASHVLLKAVSDYCCSSTGRPLIEQDFSQANQGIRLLIGEPIASQLEARVGITVGQAMLQRLLSQFSTRAFSFGSGPDPIWGNASIDEIVNTRLGAMGIF